MSKVVVGPNVENVGLLLMNTGNPIFAPNNIDSVFAAIHERLKLTKTYKGHANYEYALQNFSTDCIADKLHNVLVNLKLSITM